MDAATFAVEAQVEERHWWFTGRRRLFARLLGEMRLGKDAAILDAGTGTGANLRLLRDLGHERVTGLDDSEEAIRFCAERGLGHVRRGDVCALPFADGAFDLVLATDVIEHVDDDAAALREIARVLAPGGRALITVPAFPILWGCQDVVAHHRRRYRMRPLLERIEAAGLRPRRSFHFNYLLFAPILAARRTMRAVGAKVSSENRINAPGLNAVLTAIFALDVRTAPVMRPPFGVSIGVVAEAATSNFHHGDAEVTEDSRRCKPDGRGDQAGERTFLRNPLPPGERGHGGKH